MTTEHPYQNVGIAGCYNTMQARRLEGHDGFSICLSAVVGVLEKHGLTPRDVDAIYGNHGTELVYALGMSPSTASLGPDKGLAPLMTAVRSIALGDCSAAVVVMGHAGGYSDHASTAPWTRPSNELVGPFGLHTAVEFALMARRHMDTFGTTSEQLAAVAATIRNHGSENPHAVYSGRGPFTPQDVLNSRMVADPFHLLDCSMTAEGASAMLVTTASRAKDLTARPVYVLGTGVDHFGPAYAVPPVWDFKFQQDDIPCGYVGRRAARRAFQMAGLLRSEVDVFEFYDPYSFEIIRQFEAYEYCSPGDGGPFIIENGISVSGGKFPTTTDGGLMSFSHSVWGQILQRIVRGVEQLQGTCASNQVRDAKVAMCTSGGSGAMFTEVTLLGIEFP